ncbi:MAG: signal peptidase I [Clostridia bacterium]|nr:signal peptidase I [Clostridia bacterium]
MDKTKKILRIVSEVLIGIALVFILILFIISKTSDGPVFLGGKTTLWIMTGSMSPTIEPRTYILVEKVDPYDVEVGDVVAFVSTDPRIEGQLNTHRIISISGDRIVTKGDGNTVDDGEYSARRENIVGRYVRNMPVLTFLGRVILSPVGFAIIIVLFLLTTALAVAPGIREAMKAKEEEDEKAKTLEMERRVREEVERLKSSGVSVESLKDTARGESGENSAIPEDKNQEE